MSTNHQLVNQTSGNTEWYSPPELVEAARRVMGGIDLDPASSRAANEAIVKATKYFDEEYSVVTYLGPNIDKFVAEFDRFGAVMVRVRPSRPKPTQADMEWARRQIELYDDEWKDL